jgi:hypothetical protein
MRYVLYSQQCSSVREIDPTFSEKATNLYLGMAVDGVNPFGNQNLRHSTWPVLMVLYNLPWLVARRFFISLSLVIPGELLLDRNPPRPFFFHISVAIFFVLASGLLGGEHCSSLTLYILVAPPTGHNVSNMLR